MNYFLWISGVEHGPYSLEQIQGAIDDGEISPEQTARAGDSADWQPLHQIANLKPPTQKPSPPAPIPSKTPTASPNRDGYDKSTLAGIFQAFAVVDFIAAVFGIFVAANGNSNERYIGIVAIVSGVGGGFMLLAFAKVIECLHEMVFRLQNLERAAYQKS